MKRFFVILLLAAAATGAFAQSESDFRVINTHNSVTIGTYTGPGGNVVIPDRIQGLPVTFISAATFEGRADITSVSIPFSVSAISDYAFRGCTGLTGIVLHPGITYLGIGVFAGCTGLTWVGVPAGVAIIGYYTFQNCTGLTRVTMSDDVTDVTQYAFSGCTNLTRIRIGANVLIGANVREGDKEAFENGFDSYYDTNGRKAGVYTFRDGAWSWAAR